MKNLFRFVLTVFIIVGSLPGRAQAADWQEKVDPWVLETSTQGDTEFLIFMTEQADVSGAARLTTKLEKGTYVLNKLNEVAQRTQPAVIAVLKKYGAEYRSYRVANLIWARGSQQVIRALAERADVARLYANPHVTLAEIGEPASPLEASQPGSPSAPETIEWNIIKVNAPQVWAAGFTGQGAVIGGQDTGYQWDHPALRNHYRGWNGTSVNHDYNWHDAIHSGTGYCGADSPAPCDVYGHGTHTMGTMVGDDGGTNKIGMAPGAKWIGCRNMDNGGTGSPDSYTECFDWFLAPYPIGGDPSQGDPSKAPDVISNSWTCPPSEGCSYGTLNAIVNNVRAAGIVVVAAAGNSGSGCSTISDPPALYDASFTVGATDSSDNIAGFSSRGPVIIDGSNRQKPDISAPGVGVRSSVPGGSYTQMSGTSMATPHVAGLVGLLISAQPALRGQVDEIEALIERTALPRVDLTCGGNPSGIPNNTYGWGRIDALAAYQDLHHLTLTKTASAETILQGQPLTYTLTITHTHPLSPTMNVVLTDTIPAGMVFLSATLPYSQTGKVIEWDFASLGPGATTHVTMTVGAPLTLTGTITNSVYGVRSDQVATVTGSPVETMVVSSHPILTKTAPSRVTPGGWLTYNLTVANPNPYGPDLHHLVLTDTLPANTSFVAATQPYTLSNQVVTWELPVLPTGSQWGITLTVQSPFTFTGTISNTAYGFTSDEYGVVSGPPVRTDIYGLRVEKTASATTVTPGDLLTYTLTVTNLHPTLPTLNLILSDTLPAGVQFVSASGTYTITASGEEVIWKLDSLEAGHAWQVVVVVRVDPGAAGILRNSDYIVRSDEVTVPVSGAPVTTTVRREIWLPVMLAP